MSDEKDFENWVRGGFASGARAASNDTRGLVEGAHGRAKKRRQQQVAGVVAAVVALGAAGVTVASAGGTRLAGPAGPGSECAASAPDATPSSLPGGAAPISIERMLRPADFGSGWYGARFDQIQTFDGPRYLLSRTGFVPSPSKQLGAWGTLVARADADPEYVISQIIVRFRQGAGAEGYRQARADALCASDSSRVVAEDPNGEWVAIEETGQSGGQPSWAVLARHGDDVTGLEVPFFDDPLPRSEAALVAIATAAQTRLSGHRVDQPLPPLPSTPPPAQQVGFPTLDAMGAGWRLSTPPAAGYWGEPTESVARCRPADPVASAGARTSDDSIQTYRFWDGRLQKQVVVRIQHLNDVEADALMNTGTDCGAENFHQPQRVDTQPIADAGASAVFFNTGNGDTPAIGLVRRGDTVATVFATSDLVDTGKTLVSVMPIVAAALK